MSQNLLSVRGLERSFGGVAAVAGVDFAVDARELRVIIGPNGAGKSTFFNMLCGALRPSAGTIVFDGVEVVGLPAYCFSRLGIARKFQVPSVFNSLSVRDNLAVSILRIHARNREAPDITHVLRMLNLTDIPDVSAGHLAHGQKQWLEIGMALMSAPKLLLLDEPTAGMTPDETRETARLLLELGRNTAIVVIEHDMQFVRQLGAPTVVLHQGRIIADGPFAEIEGNETVRDIYLGRQ